MSESFYNTTSEAGADLRDYQDKAKSQEERIILFFKSSPEFLYTPSHVRDAVFGPNVPLTSVRRAMTNLTKRAELRKSTRKRKGPYGHPEHCWYRRLGSGAQWELFA